MCFLHFYLMADALDRVRAAAPRPAAYWQELALPTLSADHSRTGRSWSPVG
jgi:hypothetical protein